MFEPLQKIGCDEEELYRGIRRSQKSLIMAEPFHLIFQPLQIAPHRNDKPFTFEKVWRFAYLKLATHT